MTTIRTLLDQSLQALDGLIKWDSGRDFIVPYRVRDPIHAAAKAIRTELAKPDTAPSWHDAPTCAGLWCSSVWNARHFSLDDVAKFSNYKRPAFPRWFGPIPEDK